MLFVDIFVLYIFDLVIQQQAQTAADSSQNVRVTTCPKSYYPLLFPDRSYAFTDGAVRLVLLQTLHKQFSFYSVTWVRDQLS